MSIPQSGCLRFLKRDDGRPNLAFCDAPLIASVLNHNEPLEQKLVASIVNQTSASRAVGKQQLSKHEQEEHEECEIGGNLSNEREEFTAEKTGESG